MRTYGLSGSGMDVDQLVKDLMKAQSVTYNKVVGQKTRLEWKKADYASIYKKITDFQTALFEYTKKPTLAPKAATSTDDKYVTATAGTSAQNMSHTIHVEQLASVAMVTSQAAIGLDKTQTNLSAQLAGGSPAISGTYSFTITNGAANSGNPSAVISIDTATEGINDLVSKINKAGVGVVASYDATLDRFALTTTSTGADATIAISSGGDDLFARLDLDMTNVQGTNAKATIDGVDYETSKNSISAFGVTYKLKNTMAVGVNATIAVDSDIDKTVTAVKSLVESYNKIITEINTELTETYYRDNMPLTDEQKESLSETEIKAWEEKAKSGLLRRDPILTQLLSTMRSNFSGFVSGIDGDYNSAASIGINTGQYFDSDGKATGEQLMAGYLYIDETKLRTALEDDPEAAYKLFATNDASNPDVPAKDGLVVRMRTTLTNYARQIKTTAGTSSSTFERSSEIGRQLGDYAERISNMERRLKMVQDRYYKQFDAMEAAISRLNKQSAWLAQSFNSNSNS